MKILTLKRHQKLFGGAHANQDPTLTINLKISKETTDLNVMIFHDVPPSNCAVQFAIYTRATTSLRAFSLLSRLRKVHTIKLHSDWVLHLCLLVHIPEIHGAQQPKSMVISPYFTRAHLRKLETSNITTCAPIKSAYIIIYQHRPYQRIGLSTTLSHT